MDQIQIGTSLPQNDETTAIYEKFSEWFDIREGNKWGIDFTDYVISKEPSGALIAEIEAYYTRIEEAVKAAKKEHEDFVDRVAKDALQNLDEKEKEYIFLHPDSFTHHFGLGMWIRNKYIHGTKYDYYWHPDDLSGEIMERIASLLISNYDFGNAFYHYLYESRSFNHVRRLYFAANGEYPDAIMDQFANLPNKRYAAKEAENTVKNIFLDKSRFRKLCRKYGIPKKQYRLIMKSVDTHNRCHNIVPYDIGLLTSRELEPELRKKILCLLRATLDQPESLAMELPRIVFNQKDAVLVAVSETGKALKRFSKFNSDDDVIRAALSNDGEAIQFVKKEIRDNPDYIRLALSSSMYNQPLKLRCMAKYRDNEEIVRIALEANGCNIEYASDRLKDDLETAKFAVTHQKSWYPDSTVRNLSPRLRDNLEIALLDIREGHACVRSYSERLRDCDEVAEALIETDNTYLLHYMSNRIQEKYSQETES